MSPNRENPGTLLPIEPPTPPYALIDDAISTSGVIELYDDAAETVVCAEPSELAHALAAIDGAASRGVHAAGWLSYEAGYTLEPKLRALLPATRAVPLLWMGLFRRRRVLQGAARDRFLAAARTGAWHVGPCGGDVGQDAYIDRVARVLDYIRAGDIYQVNFTFRQRFRVCGDRLALYAELRRRQPVGHGALVRTGTIDVLSLSPELFLESSGRNITARPMKGTAARGRTGPEDATRRAWLAADEKSRAENLMIVDLLRNDLGRVCDIGSIKVPRLFEVETYRTLHQMTSTVTGRLRPGVAFPELLRATFPCGSVTGAPKIRAMEIIRELEETPRGVYTGAIGRIDDAGDIRFNVAIRTLTIAADGAAELGIGSGIVADSEPVAEWDETLLKATFLTRPQEPFQLIETLLWSPKGGYALLDRHLDRLSASAAYFGFACERAAVESALGSEAAGFDRVPMRVRLLLDENGRIEIESRPLASPDPEAVLRFAVSPVPVDSADRFLFHKTTRRAFYDGERERLQRATGCEEVVFVNEHGLLTEGSYTNLFISRGGILLTPPTSAGLLDGTLRRELLERGDPPVQEANLVPSDLDAADAVYLGNSVRGLVLAHRVG